MIKLIYVIFTLIIFCACSYNLGDEELPTQSSVQALMFADSLNQILIGQDYYSKEGESDWDFEFRSKLGSTNFSYKVYIDYFNDYVGYINRNSFEKLRTLFLANSFSTNQKMSIYRTTNLHKLSSYDSLFLTINKSGLSTTVYSIVQPKVNVLSYKLNANSIDCTVRLIPGDYVLDLNVEGDSMFMKPNARSVFHVKRNNSIDTLYILKKGGPHSITYYEGNNFENVTIFSRTYSPDLLVYFFSFANQNSQTTQNLFDVFGDNVSKYKSISTNIKPFLGYFSIISESKWQEGVGTL